MRARRFEAGNYLSRTAPRRLDQAARAACARQRAAAAVRTPEQTRRHPAVLCKQTSCELAARHLSRLPPGHDCESTHLSTACRFRGRPQPRRLLGSAWADCSSPRRSRSLSVKDDLRQRAREVVGAVPFSQHCESAPLESANLAPPLAGWRVRDDLQASGPLPLRTKTRCLASAAAGQHRGRSLSLRSSRPASSCCRTGRRSERLTGSGPSAGWDGRV